MHNLISLDGSVDSFDADPRMFYRIAERFNADVHLIGSTTARKGVQMYLGDIPEEVESDFAKPDKEESLPYWVIPDSRGILKDALHLFRGFEYCRDVIILVSSQTPDQYLSYLDERNYDYIRAGEQRVNLKEALAALGEEYDICTVLTDGGEKMNSALLTQELVDEISLIVSPRIVGARGVNFSRSLMTEEPIDLKLMGCEEVDEENVHLRYEVVRQATETKKF